MRLSVTLSTLVRVSAALVMIGAAVLYAWMKPIWDWDVIPYLYIAKMLAGGGGYVHAHAWVYDMINQLPAAVVHDLRAREHFREIVANSPLSLAQLAGFYEARQGYIGLLAILIKLHIPPFTAIQLLNAGGQILLGFMVWRWLQHMPLRGPYTRQIGISVCLAIILAFPSVMKVARWSNPDGLVAATYLAGAYLLWKQSSWWAVCAFMMVALKPTTIVFFLPLGGWFAWHRRWQDLMYWIGIGVVAGWLLGTYGHYSLTQLWHHTFIGAMAYPEKWPASQPVLHFYIYEKFAFYLEIMRMRMGGLHGRDMVLFVVFGVCSVYAVAKKQGLAMMLAGGIALHVLLFPGFWERLVVGPVLALVLMVVCKRDYMSAPAFSSRQKLAKPTGYVRDKRETNRIINESSDHRPL